MITNAKIITSALSVIISRELSLLKPSSLHCGCHRLLPKLQCTIRSTTVEGQKPDQASIITSTQATCALDLTNVRISIRLHLFEFVSLNHPVVVSTGIGGGSFQPAGNRVPSQTPDPCNDGFAHLFNAHRNHLVKIASAIFEPMI